MSAIKFQIIRFFLIYKARPVQAVKCLVWSLIQNHNTTCELVINDICIEHFLPWNIYIYIYIYIYICVCVCAVKINALMQAINFFSLMH